MRAYFECIDRQLVAPDANPYIFDAKFFTQKSSPAVELLEIALCGMDRLLTKLDVCWLSGAIMLRERNRAEDIFTSICKQMCVFKLVGIKYHSTFV